MSMLSGTQILQTTKIQVKQQFARTAQDTGSAEVQIALLARRIAMLSEHLRENPKDKASYRGLRCLLGKQVRMLRYLKRDRPGDYQSLLSKLEVNVKKV
jgi:small subunit ribosomal protein S15